ncbi:MAG: bifunctional nuclease family protein, partial [Candidatus Tectomicrobia bacterium]|nr:bifunctional nuclease family protein [Candidatus Tectomicrobia bacterium]
MGFLSIRTLNFLSRALLSLLCFLLLFTTACYNPKVIAKNSLNLQEMVVKGIIIDPQSRQPVAILQDMKGTLFLPIWIGLPEATALARGIGDIQSVRPMTHDLIVTILERMEARVSRVIISDIKESTFYATIVLRSEKSEIQIDSRPSDALVLALKAKVPIYVTENVIAEAKALN